MRDLRDWLKRGGFAPVLAALPNGNKRVATNQTLHGVSMAIQSIDPNDISKGFEFVDYGRTGNEVVNRWAFPTHKTYPHEITAIKLGGSTDKWAMFNIMVLANNGLRYFITGFSCKTTDTSKLTRLAKWLSRQDFNEHSRISRDLVTRGCEMGEISKYPNGYMAKMAIKGLVLMADNDSDLERYRPLAELTETPDTLNESDALAYVESYARSKQLTPTNVYLWQGWIALWVNGELYKAAVNVSDDKWQPLFNKSDIQTAIDSIN